jgi:hypothetical protein
MNLNSYYIAKVFEDKFTLDFICKPSERRLDGYFFNTEGKISSGFKRGSALQFLRHNSNRIEICVNGKLIYNILFGSIRLMNV